MVFERGFVKGADGNSWQGPFGYGTKINPLVISRLGPHLYHGTTGVAVFFAALARASGKDQFRMVSRKTMTPLRSKLRELTAQDNGPNLKIPIGGLIGIGSLIYGLLLIGDFLDDEEFIDDAHLAASFLTPKVIQRDRQFRIQTGAAGALLVLLGLHVRRPQETLGGLTPLDLAQVCARHLADACVQTSEGVWAWPLSPGKPPVIGFSYGAAGIAYALFNLYKYTGKEEWRDLALKGWSFVNSHYVKEEGKWRDARSVFESKYQPRNGTWRDWWASGSLKDLEPLSSPDSPADRFLEIWCHGAAGISMAQLGTLDLQDSPESRGMIETTVERMEAFADPSEDLSSLADDLCCGYAGIIDMLLEAYRILKRPSAWEAGKILFEKVWKRAEVTGDFQLSAARGEDVFAPTLFQGLSGLGYTLLRLDQPTQFPCLLRLEVRPDAPP